jgi:hypothetical protein
VLQRPAYLTDTNELYDAQVDQCADVLADVSNRFSEECGELRRGRLASVELSQCEAHGLDRERQVLQDWLGSRETPAADL